MGKAICIQMVYSKTLDENFSHLCLCKIGCQTMEENYILHDHVTAFLHEHMTNSFAYSTTFTSSACKQTKWPPLGSKQSTLKIF